MLSVIAYLGRIADDYPSSFPSYGLPCAGFPRSGWYVVPNHGVEDNQVLAPKGTYGSPLGD